MVPPTFLGYLKIEDVLEYIDNILYWAGENTGDEEFSINEICVQLSKGDARNPVEKKLCLAKITRSDNSCLLILNIVTLAMSKCDEHTTNVACAKYYDKVRNSRNRCLRIEGGKLRNDVDILQTDLYHSGKDKEGHFHTITKINVMLCTQYYFKKNDAIRKEV